MTESPFQSNLFKKINFIVNLKKLFGRNYGRDSKGKFAQLQKNPRIPNGNIRIIKILNFCFTSLL
jgi:hypothetical protein